MKSNKQVLMSRTGNMSNSMQSENQLVERDLNTNKQSFNATQSSIKKNKSNPNTSQSFQKQPYNTVTLSKTYKKSGLDPFATLLSDQRLSKFLKEFGVFPEKQRSLAWKQILNLPLNTGAFKDLCDLGVHPAFQKIKEKYPLQSDSLLSRLTRTLSTLAHYCPLYAEVDYLPELVFPFVKLFQRGEELIMFEVVLSLLVQIGQKFFEFFPNPPVGVLQLHDQLLRLHDPELMQHLKSIHFQGQTYVWPSMRSMFTDRFNAEQWVKVMDHIVMFHNSPQFLLCVSVAYLQYFRATFLSMKSPDQLDVFFARKNPFDIDKIIARALKLLQNSDPSQFCIGFEQNLPLTKEQYQIFNVYPKTTVEYYKQMRSQMSSEEDLIQKRQETIDTINKMTEEMIRNEENFMERQNQLVVAQKDRAEILEYENQMRALKIQKVDQELRDKRLHFIQKQEEIMRVTLEQQEQLRKQEDEILFQQMQKHKQIENQQIVARKEEEALLDLEFKAFMRFQGVVTQKNQEERNRQIQQEVEFKNRQQQISSQLKIEQWRTEEQEQRLKQEMLRNQYIQQMQMVQQANDRAYAEQQVILNQMNEEQRLLQLEREKKLRELAANEQFKIDQQNAIIEAKERAIQEHERLLLQKQAKQFSSQLNRSSLPHSEIAFPQVDNEREQISRFHQKNRQEEFNQHYQELEEITKNMNEEDNRKMREFQQNRQRELLSQQDRRDLLLKRSLYVDEKMQRKRSVEKSKEEYDQFREQLHEQLAQKRSRQEIVNDEQLRNLVDQRERDIMDQVENVRRQILHEEHQTGKFRPYAESSYSQFDDERVLGNNSDFSGSSDFK